MESQADPELRAIHNRAGLVTPDGVPLVWLSRLSGRRDVGRVYGPDLMLELSEISTRTGYRHFYYGGGAGVADLLAFPMARRFEGLRVVGPYTPPLRPLAPDARSGEHTSELQAPKRISYAVLCLK